MLSKPFVLQPGYKHEAYKLIHNSNDVTRFRCAPAPIVPHCLGLGVLPRYLRLSWRDYSPRHASLSKVTCVTNLVDTKLVLTTQTDSARPRLESGRGRLMRRLMRTFRDETRACFTWVTPETRKSPVFRHFKNRHSTRS